MANSTTLIPPVSMSNDCQESKDLTWRWCSCSIHQGFAHVQVHRPMQILWRKFNPSQSYQFANSLFDTTWYCGTWYSNPALERVRNEQDWDDIQKRRRERIEQWIDLPHHDCCVPGLFITWWMLKRNGKFDHSHPSRFYVQWLSREQRPHLKMMQL